jgi:hypothetical protein
MRTAQISGTFVIINGLICALKDADPVAWAGSVWGGITRVVNTAIPQKGQQGREAGGGGGGDGGGGDGATALGLREARGSGGWRGGEGAGSEGNGSSSLSRIGPRHETTYGAGRLGNLLSAGSRHASSGGGGGGLDNDADAAEVSVRQQRDTVGPVPPSAAAASSS